MQGQFIVLEGIEGAGKSTAIQWVQAFLRRHQIKDIVLTREPGGTPIAEAIRHLLKEKHKNDQLCDKAELLLFYAARVQLVETVILPALQRGAFVIGDRHDLSTQAYQGAGRKIDLQWLTHLKEQVLGDFKPNLTFYLDIDPKIGLQRAQNRGKLDRFEQEELAFFERTRARFLELAQHDKTIVVIDASQSMEEVKAKLESELARLFYE